MNKILAIAGVIVLLVVGFLVLQEQESQESTQGGNVTSGSVDIIGTKTGTSTAGVGFRVTATGGQSATTTYPTWIGGDTDVAVYTFLTKNASTSANLHFSVLFSNDTDCATATTSADYGNPILMSQINWFDARPFIAGLNEHASYPQISLPTGTSTMIWDTSGAPGTGKNLVLNNLNVQCLALQVSGSSTVVWSQLKTKQY